METYEEGKIEVIGAWPRVLTPEEMKVVFELYEQRGRDGKNP